MCRFHRFQEAVKRYLACQLELIDYSLRRSARETCTAGTVPTFSHYFFTTPDFTHDSRMCE